MIDRYDRVVIKDMEAANDYDYNDDGLRTGVKELPPVPLYGMYGRVKEDTKYMQHMKAIQEHRFVAGVAYTLEEALKIATIYRFAEYDVKYRRMYDGTTFVPWAALNSPAICAKSFDFRWDMKDYYELVEVIPRKKACPGFPIPTWGMQDFLISVQISEPVIAFTKPNMRHNRMMEVSRAVEELTLPTVNIFVPKEGAVIAVSALPPVEQGSQEQDFGEAAPGPAVTMPAPPSALEGSGAADTSLTAIEEPDVPQE